MVGIFFAHAFHHVKREEERRGGERLFSDSKALSLINGF
jgi:hypothetical protein